MGNKKDLMIIRAYQPFLYMLTVYDSDKFRTTNGRVLIRNILLAFGVSFSLFVYAFLFLPAELYQCIVNDFDLNVIGREGAFFLADSPLLVVYGSFWLKREKIIETCDRLQEIVKKRKNL